MKMWINFIFVIFLMKVYVKAIDRFMGLLNNKCVVIRGDCPHEDVTFWLYTNKTYPASVKINPNNLSSIDLQSNRSLFILIHGYTGHRDFAPNTNIRSALLNVLDSDPYVISVDYGPLVPQPCYLTSVENLPLVSKCIGHLINNMIDQNLIRNDDIHIIGFSLGAHVAGQIANHVKTKLKHITGLDPAKPLFVTATKDYILDAEDADFVDVIHTDVLVRGMIRRMGHADFYPNIGSHQPGCITINEKDPGSCNHERATQYYSESIYNSNGFWAYSCTSWVHKVFGSCSTKTNDQLMGFYVNQSVFGSFFLETSHESPFALGPIVESHNTSLQMRLIDYDYDYNYEETYNKDIYKLEIDFLDNYVRNSSLDLQKIFN